MSFLLLNVQLSGGQQRRQEVEGQMEKESNNYAQYI